MALILLALLPFLGAGGVVAVGRMGRGAVFVAALLPPAGALLLLLSLLPEQPLIVSWPWLPAFGLELAFRLDGLSFLFAFLILAVGLLILGYSIAYFGADRSLPRFLSLMLAFMGACSVSCSPRTCCCS